MADPLGDFLAAMCNLLDGTANLARNLVDRYDWEPAPSSQAAAEIETNESGPGGAWGPEPAKTALSFAAMINYAAADHLATMASLVDRDGTQTLFGMHVAARCSIEASAVSWWLLDPALTVRERVGRSFRLRLRTADDSIRMLTEMSADQSMIDAQRRQREEILRQAVARGIPVHTRGGQPSGINVAMPTAAALVGDVLRVWDFRVGEGLYSFLSGVVHSAPLSLQQFFEVTGSTYDSESAVAVPALRPGMLHNIVQLVLLSFLSGFDRVVGIHGWNDKAWPQWGLHVKQKLLETRT